MPGVALAELPITVAVDSVDGCIPCDTSLTPCQVTVSGTSITLAMQALTCPVQTNGCEEVCGNVTETCTIPPLPAGTYTVDIASAKRSSGFRTRELVVGNDPTGDGCTLPPKGTSPAPLDGSKYSTACSTDTDCTTVLAGNVCSACGCGNTAIAVSDKDRYEADYRAASSQCEPSLPAPCPFCAAPTAFCVISPDALVGKCSLGEL